MIIRSIFASSLLAIAGLASVGANVTGTFPVTSSVVAACQFSIPDFNFGNVDMTQLPSGIQPSGITNNISIVCTSGTNASIVITSSNDLAPNGNIRRMKSAAGNLINYVFYRPNNTQGNPYLPSGEAIPYASTTGITPGNIALQARFFKADVPADNYIDTVTAVVTF